MNKNEMRAVAELTKMGFECTIDGKLVGELKDNKKISLSFNSNGIEFVIEQRGTTELKILIKLLPMEIQMILKRQQHQVMH